MKCDIVPPETSVTCDQKVGLRGEIESLPHQSIQGRESEWHYPRDPYVA